MENGKDPEAAAEERLRALERESAVTVARVDDLAEAVHRDVGELRREVREGFLGLHEAFGRVLGELGASQQARKAARASRPDVPAKAPLEGKKRSAAIAGSAAIIGTSVIVIVRELGPFLQALRELF